MTVVETFAADRFLYEALEADATLTGKVHDGLAPQGTATPYVVFQHQAGTDHLTANRTRIWSNLLYAVRVVGEGNSFVALQEMADAVDAALKRASGTNALGEIYSCAREGVLKRAYPEGEKHYREILQTYRLYVQGA